MEQICGGSTEFPSQEKAEVSLMNLIIPLCLRVGSGRGDVAELHQNDISYLVTVVLNAMSPPGGSASNQTIRGVVDTRAGSLTFTGSRETKRPARVRGTLYQAAFLALRVLCVCFEQRLSKEWSRIARVMRDLGRRNEAAPELWSFLEFVVTHRTPLYIVLQPFLLHKISQPPIGDHERHMQFLIRERMRGTPPSDSPRSRGALLLDLARELRELKDDLEEHKYQHAAAESNRRATEVYISYPHSCDGGRFQRPSLISLLTGLEQKSTNCLPTENVSQILSAPKANESTTTHSPESPMMDTSREHNKSRLQRSKAQSRKTLRFRRGKSNHNEGKTNENELEPVTGSQNHGDQSWETNSPTSPISSTSCCKDKQIQLRDDSHSPRVGSQQSLLMVYETQDEDTLI